MTITRYFTSFLCDINGKNALSHLSAHFETIPITPHAHKQSQIVELQPDRARARQIEKDTLTIVKTHVLNTEIIINDGNCATNF